MRRSAKDKRRAAQPRPDGPPSAPPLARDPWAYVCVLAVLPALLRSWGAPLGEPFADDFDFLRHALLEAPGSFFDGFSTPYWRPLARQVYFGLLSPVILSHPGWVAALHTVLLAASGLLFYRALRPRWSRAAAAGAATFPLLMESSRMLIAWPSHFQDLGALFFAALALHEASRSRMITGLAAMLGSLLTKESGVVIALALPFVAPTTDGARRSRPTWALAALGVVGVWGAVYLTLLRSHAVTFPGGDPSTTVTLPWLARFGWSTWHSLRASLSLAAGPGAWDGFVWLGAGVVVLGGIARIGSNRAARARLAAAWSWVAWGVAWFLVSSAVLAEVYPAWWPNRAIVGAVGIGIAVTALAWAAHPHLVAALLLVRLFAFFVSPAAPRRVAAEPPRSGAAFDFVRMVRLQRLVRDTRRVLTRRFPTLPRGTIVSQHNLPLLSEYAFAGDKGIQVWYRDTTVRWARFEEFSAGELPNVVGLVEWQPRGARQVALVETEAMRVLLTGTDLLRLSRWREGAAAFMRADALQRDRGALVFLGTAASKRALCLIGLGELDAAARAARDGLALWPDNPDSHYALAVVFLKGGQREAALSQLDSLLAIHPDDAGAQGLRDRLRGSPAVGAP